jgi:hypothetical protein
MHGSKRIGSAVHSRPRAINQGACPSLKIVAASPMITAETRQSQLNPFSLLIDRSQSTAYMSTNDLSMPFCLLAVGDAWLVTY